MYYKINTCTHTRNTKCWIRFYAANTKQGNCRVTIGCYVYCIYYIDRETQWHPCKESGRGQQNAKRYGMVTHARMSDLLRTRERAETTTSSSFHVLWAAATSAAASRRFLLDNFLCFLCFEVEEAELGVNNSPSKIICSTSREASAYASCENPGK